MPTESEPCYIQGNENQLDDRTRLREFELKPHHSVEFQVYGSDPGYRVAVDYGVPELLRDHIPDRISRWLPRPTWPTALSPLIKSYSLVAEAK